MSDSSAGNAYLAIHNVARLTASWSLRGDDPRLFIEKWVSQYSLDYLPWGYVCLQQQLMFHINFWYPQNEKVRLLQISVGTQVSR